jgi:hypothetical protein
MTPRKGQEQVGIKMDAASQGRAKLMARNHEQVGRAMRALVEALTCIQRVRDDLEKERLAINQCTESGKAQMHLIIETERALQAVTLAITRVPEEFWTLYLSENHIGIAEAMQRIQAA